MHWLSLGEITKSPLVLSLQLFGVVGKGWKDSGGRGNKNLQNKEASEEKLVWIFCLGGKKHGKREVICQRI